MTSRLARLIENLACANCGRTFSRDGDALSCAGCGANARVTRDTVIFGEGSGDAPDPWLRSLKERVKTATPRLYGWLIAAVSPVHAIDVAAPLFDEVDPATHFVLDYGSGPIRLHPDVINVDITPYRGVDLVVAGTPLPLRDECVDAIVSVAVLEHVDDPHAVVRDFERLLKPGGRLQVYVPFMQGVHGAPDDFQRWTPHGLEKLFERFDDRRVVVAAGPTSALVWILQEWFAITFSFGSRALYRLLYMIGFLFTPLKFLDAALRHHPMASKIASGYLITARRRMTTQ